MKFKSLFSKKKIALVVNKEIEYPYRISAPKLLEEEYYKAKVIENLVSPEMPREKFDWELVAIISCAIIGFLLLTSFFVTILPNERFIGKFESNSNNNYLVVSPALQREVSLYAQGKKTTRLEIISNNPIECNLLSSGDEEELSPLGIESNHACVFQFEPELDKTYRLYVSSKKLSVFKYSIKSLRK